MDISFSPLITLGMFDLNALFSSLLISLGMFQKSNASPVHHVAYMDLWDVLGFQLIC